ncbi:MAG: hypothetical protein K1X74_00085 [Pirellulales bacterium]|nr:hypothetical protein [Pirellulales bacterium]
MNRIRQGCVFAATLAVCLLATSAAWAQDEAAGGEASPRSFVAQYTVILLFVALGLMAVCRPARRADAIKQTKQG